SHDRERRADRARAHERGDDAGRAAEIGRWSSTGRTEASWLICIRAGGARGSARAAEPDDVERDGWVDRTDGEWTGSRPEEEFTTSREHVGFTRFGCTQQAVDVRRTDAGRPAGAGGRWRHPVGDVLRHVAHHVERPGRRDAG